MNSSLESFSTELFFEIFEYLSSYDLFQSFFNQSDRLNTIVHSYPLHLNFRSIFRLEFDYICFHLHPKQVISLILSDETIPYQVSIFKEYFPFFQQQFIHLQSITFIEIFDEKINLPKSVKSLEIRKYDTYKYFHFNFDQLLKQQANVLTHLKIDRIGLLNSANIQFPSLTHLIVDGGFNLDADCYNTFSNQYENVDATSIFQRLGCSIKHLYLFIDKQNRNMKINLEQFSHCLNHLTLHFAEDIPVSFQTLEKCLINLHQLTHLTVQASGKNDLFDGYQWKNFLVKTKIKEFNFKFQLLNHHHSESILLKSFRSSFWIEHKHCYVRYYNDQQTKQTFLYTIPYFQFHEITYPSSMFSSGTKTLSNIEKDFFCQKKINSLAIDINHFRIPPIHRFTQVKSLILFGSRLLSLDNLKKIIDCNRVEQLDVYFIEILPRRELEKLIKHLPRLNSLTMEYNPLFIMPSQIHTVRLEGDSEVISINNLYHIIPNIKTLQIPIKTKDQMLDIIDQFDYINNFEFICDDLRNCIYLEIFVEKLHLNWLEKNSYRLRMNYFTFRQGDEYQRIQMAIGGPKTKK